MNKLTVMRGVPGSGKSFKARSLGGLILSTDDFFMTDGIYTFDPKKLPEAHNWNQMRAAKAMGNNFPHVVIDNTCCEAWEAREYCAAAQACGYEVEFVHSDTPWATHAFECAARCQHDVGILAIQAMLKRFVPTLTVEMCLAAKAPWEL